MCVYVNLIYICNSSTVDSVSILHAQLNTYTHRAASVATTITTTVQKCLVSIQTIVLPSHLLFQKKKIVILFCLCVYAFVLLKSMYFYVI